MIPARGRAGRRRDGERQGGEQGQATVELALALPVLLIALLVVVQAGLVVADQVRTVHAAREAARAAAVDPRSDAAAAAVSDAGGRSCTVRVDRPDDVGAVVRVDVRCPSRTEVALVGPLIDDVYLHATASMRVER